MSAADRARARLVDGLRDGVLRTAAGRGGRQSDPAIEEAFRTVPRHLFLPGVPLGRAYADEAVAVQAVDGVTTSSASQPSMMAIMLGQLDLQPGHRVLEIGAGTGYNAALMARIVGPCGHVVAVDIDADLVDRAAGHLAAAGVDGVELVSADGARGYPPAAPYDRIVLTVGSGDVRPEWVAQLVPGGRLLLPLAVRGAQLSVALDLGEDHVLRSASVNRCAFVRLRGVGAVAEGGVTAGGLALLPADDRRVSAQTVDAALSVPGRRRPAPLLLAAGDLWDGFGLWLALTEPGTCRLVAPRSDPDDPAGPGRTAELLRLDPGNATVGLLAGESDGPGLAALVLEPGVDPDSRGSWRVQVQAFGPGGDTAADRLSAACDAWEAAGRPTSAALHLTVVPRGSASPAPQDAPLPTTVVDKEHCRVLVAVRPS
jgi:protein-L-isoaspartate(D-aspartate) O-methyltransferase